MLVDFNTSIDIAKLQQSENKWLYERKKRITASNAYALFTYSKNKNPDWQNKIKNLIFPKNYTLSNFEYGKKNRMRSKTMV